MQGMAVFTAVPAGQIHDAEARAAQPAAPPSCHCGSVQTLVAGETLFVEGEIADCAYELLAGFLRVCRILPDGRRQITGFLSAGRVISVPVDGLHGDTVEAVTPATVLRYSRSRFERRLRDDPPFLRRLLADAQADLRWAQHQAVLLGRKSALEKVASFLLQMQRQQGGDRDITLPVRRRDIADYLGLSVETVSRCLTRLRAAQVIDLRTSDDVAILDPEGLEDRADGNIA